MAPYKAEMTAQDPLHPKVSCPVGEVKLMSEHQQKETRNICSQDVSCYQLNTPAEEPAVFNDSDEVFCRICHEGPSCGELLSPCQCSGSLAMVHRACLEHWLTSSNSGHCELCHHQFTLERLPKPLTEWWCSPSMQQQRRTLCGDAACFLFITPLASLSGWLCVQGAMDLYHTNAMEALGLLVLTMALFTIYVFWTVVSVRYHVHLFRTWKKTDQRVQLQIPPSAQKNRRKHRTLSLKLLTKTTNKETVV